MTIQAAHTFAGTDRPLIRRDGEAPRRPATLAAYAIDPFAVTNAAFGAFVAETGHVTLAERQGSSFVFAGHLPEPAAPRASWWVEVAGAAWDRPTGPASDLDGLDDHPVVHVAHEDAAAFAAWAGGRLPNEAEWEHAARGGLDDPRYPWGDREPDERDFLPCNIWQGIFPDLDTGADGWRGTAPVDAFAPNGYGLHNLAGNVWEWCGEAAGPARIAKGGSYLCHPSYCHRYRIAARSLLAPGTTTGHIGLRVVFDL